MIHRHLSELPSDLYDLRTRLSRADLSMEYIQGVVDGSLLAYSTTLACHKCRRVFEPLNSRVDSLQVFLESTSLGSGEPPNPFNWEEVPYWGPK